jgi:LysM repeat protein
MRAEMNFWIEINALARAANSADLQIYLVAENKPASFFESDWRNSADVELVGTIDRAATFHHQHTLNSSHHLVALTVNADGTVGSKSLNIDNDFWIIVYNTSPNLARGWDLRYHASNLCTNNNGWYRGSQAGWSITAQTGCPDAHIHVARRTEGFADRVQAIVTAGEVSETATFSFAPLPNLSPNATRFLSPNAGTYEGNVIISWDPATDPNNDSLTYNIDLLDAEGNVLSNLLTDGATTSAVLNSAALDDGEYSLAGEVCDTSPLCTSFALEYNFFIDNVDDIYNISSLSLSSDGNDISVAEIGDRVTLSFMADGEIASPSVIFYSGGTDVTNEIVITSLGDNYWSASYVVDENDTAGGVSFVLNGTNLANTYVDTSDESLVTVVMPIPSPTPTPTPTPTATPTPTSNSLVNLLTAAFAPKCTDSITSERPQLFQTTVQDNKVTVFFTPLGGVSEYYLSYSNNNNAEEHGVMVTLSDQGVQQWTIGDLNFDATYYFKVRGHKGCATGEWSNIQAVQINQAASVVQSLNTTQENESSDACSYLVKSGDTLFGIAQRLNVDLEELININRLRYPAIEELLQINWQLDLPCQENENKSTSSEMSLQTYELHLKLKNGNKPLVGAQIELHSDPKSGVTDQNGELILRDIEPGEHTLKIAYQDVETEQKIQFEGEKQTIDLTVNVTLQAKKFVWWHWLMIFIGIICAAGVGFYVRGGYKKRSS